MSQGRHAYKHKLNWKRCAHTSLDDGGFVAGADGQHFENTACGPEQFLVCVCSHDVNQSLRSTTSQDDQLR